MKLYHAVATLFLLSFGFIGCYTILSHPTVKKDDYTNKIKFYDDCFSCHSKSDMISYGFDYLNKYPDVGIADPIPIWVSPTEVSPWWIGIVIPSEIQNSDWKNDETRLRNQDGGRSSAPTTFDSPSRNTGSANNSSSTHSSSNNSVDSSKDRNSRESNSTKTRDNSGERKK